MAQRNGIMLPYWWCPNRYQKKYPSGAIVQPKINGNRCRAVPHDIGVHPYWTLLSSSEATIRSCSHINETLQNLAQLYEFDGELYCHGWTHEMISGLVRTTSYTPAAAVGLEYWIFDLIDEKMPQIARLELLRSLDLFPLVVVEYAQVETIDQIEEQYYSYLQRGFEGVIIRHPTAPYIRKKTITMMKLKPSLLQAFEVVAVVQEKDLLGLLKEQAGAITCRTDSGELFNVSGMTREMRQEVWRTRAHVPGRWAEIKFQNLSSDREVPVMPSFKRFVQV